VELWGGVVVRALLDLGVSKKAEDILFAKRGRLIVAERPSVVPSKVPSPVAGRLNPSADSRGV
jgi:hypothetical protein